MHEPEQIAAFSGIVIFRIPAPNGWLYVTKTIVRPDYNRGSSPIQTVTVATTFVPDPSTGR